jgi:hypothetical protein
MQTLARKLFPAHDWPKVHGSQEPEKNKTPERKKCSQFHHLSKNIVKMFNLPY